MILVHETDAGMLIVEYGLWAFAIILIAIVLVPLVSELTQRIIHMGRKRTLIIQRCKLFDNYLYFMVNNHYSYDEVIAVLSLPKKDVTIFRYKFVSEVESYEDALHTTQAIVCRELMKTIEQIELNEPWFSSRIDKEMQ
jgi:hypothetical protein